jgi:cytochrome b subunit of formate dehydrogenase
MSAKKATPKTTRPAVKETRKTSPRTYERFHRSQRVAHVLLLTSFTLLGITGLAQKFSTSAIAVFIVKIFGNVETMRLVHHGAAIVLMLLTIYHILDAGYKTFVRRSRMTMLPSFQDLKDAIQAFAYNLGLKKKRPQMGRYTFEEKAEYWALVWGTVIMGITGFIMWNPIAAAKFLPGEIIPASKAAHGGEAVLAVLAIIVWHMYGVHIKKFNKSMWTGKLTEEEMLHEHPLELADIKAGVAERPVDPKTLRKRRAIYFPVAGVLTAAMLLGVYGFTNSEKTALTTIPPAIGTVQVYVPQTPTPIPSSAAGQGSGPFVATWNGSVGPLFQSTCGACHGANSTTGLSMDTYANIIKGGKNGPVILPGDPGNSLLVQVQSSGSHPGLFSAEGLARIREWIAAGAPEK